MVFLTQSIHTSQWLPLLCLFSPFLQVYIFSVSSRLCLFQPSTLWFLESRVFVFLNLFQTKTSLFVVSFSLASLSVLCLRLTIYSISVSFVSLSLPIYRSVSVRLVSLSPPVFCLYMSLPVVLSLWILYLGLFHPHVFIIFLFLPRHYFKRL